MAEIQGGRWDNLLRRLFPVKGQAIAPALAPELLPVVVVQPFDFRMRAILGDKAFGCYTEQVGVAGQFGCTQIYNPAGSGLLFLLRELRVYSDGAQSVYLGHFDATTVLANTANVYPLDSRLQQGATATSAMPVTYGTNAAVSARLFGRVRASVVNTEYLWQNPVIVRPGHYFKVRCGAVNTSLFTSMAWHEVQVESSELSLG